MLRIALLCLACAALLVPGVASEGSGWTQLKPGMSAIEAATLLGRPLLRNAGKGFELWIYSGGAEVLFYRGPVMAWTAPAVTPSAASSETRRFSHDVFFLPGYRMPSRGAASAGHGDREGYSLREILRYRGGR